MKMWTEKKKTMHEIKHTLSTDNKHTNMQSNALLKQSENKCINKFSRET